MSIFFFLLLFISGLLDRTQPSDIQARIDAAAAAGGGRVVIPRGTHTTGSLFLRSNVELHLEEGAVLLGSPLRKDYEGHRKAALIVAIGQHNISITGKGMIDGQGRLLMQDIFKRLKEGTLDDAEWRTKRPAEQTRTNILYMEDCTDVMVKGVAIKDATSWVTHYERCDRVLIDSIRIESTAYWNNDGIDLVDCRNVRVTNCTIDAADDAICLKSSNRKLGCENIYVSDCRLRSSASAFKMGTASQGGFRNITVRNLEVFDTYRSAIALEAVDGGRMENIDIRNIRAKNTGNALFIRLAHRNRDTAYSVARSIYIGDVQVEVPAGKPDAGYEMEGPLLKYPPGTRPGKPFSVSPWNDSYPDSTAIRYRHNVFPSTIAGLPGHPVQNVRLENIEIIYKGGGDPAVQYFPPDSLSVLTEAEKDYPEFSMFGELPAWGLFVRHVDGLTMKNVRMIQQQPDYRAALVMDDVQKVLIHQLDTIKAPETLLDLVQPMAGTAPAATASALKHSEGTEKNANTIPSVTLPFAMTQWTPETRRTEQKCLPPYFYKDNRLTGFRATHWLSGSCVQDYGSFTIMPLAGKLSKEVSVPFSHADERSTPAYYRVRAGGVQTEMTATLRSGMIRFTMEKDDTLYVQLLSNSDEAQGGLSVDAGRQMMGGQNPVHRIYQGWGQPAGFSGWIYMRADRVAAAEGSFSAEGFSTARQIASKKDMGVYQAYVLKKGESVTFSIGTSFTSMEAAARNMEAEIGNSSFEVIRKKAEETWLTALGKIVVSSSDSKKKRTFYTALYHSFQHPRLFSDVDGSYPSFAGNSRIMNAGKRAYYDDFSTWDIFRTQLPLMEILDQSLTADFVQSLVNKGRQGGWLPIFPCWNSYTSAMIGDHVAAYIAAVYAKGNRNFDTTEAYRLMRKNAFEVASDPDYQNGMGRRALDSWMKYGYIPMEDSVPVAFHKKEQVSRTLEYAYDDYAISVMARGMGKMNDYRLLKERGRNYRNVFDPAVGMMRGRYADGSWYGPFQADTRQPYITEGTPRQYGFFVPHDVPGLAGLMGGKKKLEDALDTLFAKGEYWHGNEPGHQIPFMYTYTDAPWKTTDVVQEILKEEYSDGPGGLSGNDDAGQMSAWYVMAAMGFYPVDPVSGEYRLSAPIFDDIRLKTASGKTLHLVVRRKKPEDRYIRELVYKGKLLENQVLEFNMLQQGGTIELVLGPRPGTGYRTK
jgi:predicted alpha-1,2-mannosidase